MLCDNFHLIFITTRITFFSETPKLFPLTYHHCVIQLSKFCAKETGHKLIIICLFEVFSKTRHFWARMQMALACFCKESSGKHVEIREIVTYQPCFSAYVLSRVHTDVT